ncbi:MAG: hypothetical protein KA143_00705 [Saprospiraceae bacterium]|nr:hypothetical protein [Saprospiraceae bacterium]
MVPLAWNPTCNQVLDALESSLEAKGYKIEYKIAQGAEHNESAWAKRVDKPLGMFFGN